MLKAHHYKKINGLVNQHVHTPKIGINKEIIPTENEFDFRNASRERARVYYVFYLKWLGNCNSTWQLGKSAKQAQ